MMKRTGLLAVLCGTIGLVAMATQALGAASDGQKCSGAKAKVAGKHYSCTENVFAKYLQNGTPPDLSKCSATFTKNWDKAENKVLDACPDSVVTVEMDDFLKGQATTTAFIVAGYASIPICGDEQINGAGEQCDGTNLGGATCASLGFTSGELACTDCVLDTSDCKAGDVNLVPGNLLEGVTILGVTGTAVPRGLKPSQPLRTGQTTSYGTGSDADALKGVVRAYTDNADGTITDNNTELMWEKKDQSGGIHDWSNTYTWTASLDTTNDMDGTITTVFLAGLNGGGGYAGHTDWRIPNAHELQSIANYQNSAPAVGVEFNNGCAPGCTVLTCSCTIFDTDMGTTDEAKATDRFYWSSTTYQRPGETNEAWVVNFEGGIVNRRHKGTDPAGPLGNDLPRHVRAVRGGSWVPPGVVPSQPLRTGQVTPYGTGSDADELKGIVHSYTDNLDGTITDNRTALMWEKKDQQTGGIHNYGDYYTWSGASFGGTNVMDGTLTTVFLAALNTPPGFAGHMDWRIPNVNELQSIADYQNTAPGVGTAFNNSCAADCTVDGAGGTTMCSCTWTWNGYWSSTTYPFDPERAFTVNFWGTFVGPISKDTAVNTWARAVRGGS